MRNTEEDTESLKEKVVKGAVGKGLETELREPIVEAVEEAESDERTWRRRIPLIGVVSGLAMSIGYFLGRRREMIDSEPLSDEKKIKPDFDDVELGKDVKLEPSNLLTRPRTRTRRLLIAIGLLGAAVYVRKRLSGDSSEDWEPIKEIKTPQEGREVDVSPSGSPIDRSHEDTQSSSESLSESITDESQEDDSMDQDEM